MKQNIEDFMKKTLENRSTSKLYHHRAEGDKSSKAIYNDGCILYESFTPCVENNKYEYKEQHYVEMHKNLVETHADYRYIKYTIISPFSSIIIPDKTSNRL